MKIHIFKLLIGGLLTSTLLFTSCNIHLRKEVVETYDDGSPKKVNFYKLFSKDTEVVKETMFYESGEKKYVGYYKKGKKDGRWIFWFDTGEKWSEGYFLTGLRTGEAKVYHENGTLFYTGLYAEGKKTGLWTFYNEAGEKVNEITFEEGKPVNQQPVGSAK